MPRVEVEAEVEVWCDKCGEGLCRQTDSRGSALYVKPCQKCLDEAYQEGYDDGLIEGKQSDD